MEVERCFAVAVKDSAISPETALVDVEAIRDCVVRTPVLNFDERQKLIVQIDRQQVKLRNRIDDLQQQSAMRDTSCTWEYAQPSQPAE